MRHQRLARHGLRPRDRIGEDQRDVDGLFVHVEPLLALPAVGEPHLAVVCGADHEGLAQQPELRVGRLLGVVPHCPHCCEHVGEVVVRHLHEVGVEIEVVDLGLGAGERAGTAGHERLEDGLRLRLGHKALRHCVRQLHVALQPLVAVAAGCIPPGVRQYVVRVHQRDDEAEFLLVRGEALLDLRPVPDEIEHALVAHLNWATRGHDPAVVVGDATTHLIDGLVGAGIRCVPAVPSVGLKHVDRVRACDGARRVVAPIDVWRVAGVVLLARGLRQGRRGCRGVLAAVPLALVHGVVAGGCHDARDIRHLVRGQQVHLWVVRPPQVVLQHVLHTVLCRVVATHDCGTCRRARARVGVRVVELHAVLGDLCIARQVLLKPALRPQGVVVGLLVGHEDHDVHVAEVDRHGARPRSSR